MTQTAQPLIVAVGASAGGLQPLEGLLRTMPDTPAMAFVVVTHLSPDRSSMLSEILGRATWMTVKAAEDGDPVTPGHVYVLPPNSIMTITNGCLRLRPEERDHREHNPIDVFFSSLAIDQTDCAVGILLSGGGSDGTLGMKAIKEAGGITMAQGADHSQPSHRSMPYSAIATGSVDLVLPVEAMAERLVGFASGDRLKGLEALEHTESAAEYLVAARQTICNILRKHVGHDFSGYKPSTFLRRVRRRMQVLHLASVDAFIEHLRTSPDEVMALFRDLLINVTSFFRDPESFDVLGKYIGRLVEDVDPGRPLRIWVPGCSTGEEVYSIAILVLECIHAMEAPPAVQIFATDIDESALTVARVGRYPTALLADVSAERLERFFVSEGGTYRVTKEVRDLCVFSSHSLVRDPPFSRMDMISCRNLLIYLNAELQNRVIPVFHYALRPGGYLFLGTAENVTRYADLFLPVDKKHRIFQRSDRTSTPIPFPLYMPGGHASSLIVESVPSMRHSTVASVRQLSEARVLERHAPAFVVVDGDGNVIHFSSGTGKYIEAPAGAPTRQLASMARKGLRLDLGSVLAEARQKQAAATRAGLSVDVGDYVQMLDIVAEPLPQKEDQTLYLVLFRDTGLPLSAEEVAAHGRRGHADDGALEHLERELRESRERLQSMIEEYETAIEELKSSNEELVSMNEELQSATEELETGKEEQQSVNEELHTVNQELHRKISELDRANSDMRNLLSSTPIATIFLDRKLVIRSFTPDATQVFNLIGTDVGRPLTDIVGRLDYAALRDDIRAVAMGGEAVERRVSTRPDAEGVSGHFLARLRAYRDAGGDVDGVVVTFIDVTSLVEAEVRQRQLVAELNHRVKNMLAVVMAMASQTRKGASGIDDFFTVFEERVQALSRTYELLSREQWNDIPMKDLVDKAVTPFVPGKKGVLHTSGPDIVLTPKASLSLGMVIHELTTNAVKHGALSVPGGRLEVRWGITVDDAGGRVDIRWVESGVKNVSRNPSYGFGIRLIEGELVSSLQGQVKLDFTDGGLVAVMTFPAKAAFVSVDPALDVTKP